MNLKFCAFLAFFTFMNSCKFVAADPVKIDTNCFNETESLKILNLIKRLRSSSKDVIFQKFNELCQKSIEQPKIIIEIRIEGYFGFTGETIGAGICNGTGALLWEIFRRYILPWILKMFFGKDENKEEDSTGIQRNGSISHEQNPRPIDANIKPQMIEHFSAQTGENKEEDSTGIQRNGSISHEQNPRPIDANIKPQMIEHFSAQTGDNKEEDSTAIQRNVLISHEQNPRPIDANIKRQMIEQFSAQTGLDYAYSESYIHKSNFDLEDALNRFKEFRNELC